MDGTSPLTEQINPRFEQMDTLDTESIMYMINDEDAKVASAVRKAIPNAAMVAERAGG